MRKIRIPDNLTTLAYKTIKNYIWEGRLDDGARLTEDFLSQKLGISKSPIREALNRLETEGLIRIEPRRGAYLQKLSTKEVADLYDLRQALEVHAVTTARVTPELIAELRQSIERLNSSREAKDKLRCIEEDVSFHSLLAAATGNERLVRAVENVQHQVWLFRRKNYELTGSHAVAAHAAIVDALERNDRETAARLVREHISGVCRELIQFLESRPPDDPPARRRPASLP